MRKLTCSPKIEVIGAAARAFTDNINARDFQDLLIRFGFEEISDLVWYPMHKLLNLLNEMSEQPNWWQNYVAMGMKRAEVAKMPPEAAKMSYEDFLMNWNKIYQAQHRGGDVGQLSLEKLGERHYLVNFNIIYPDDFIYGVAYGMAKRFLPDGIHFSIKYQSDEPRMDEGGNVTKLDITWEA